MNIGKVVLRITLLLALIVSGIIVVFPYIDDYKDQKAHELRLEKRAAYQEKKRLEYEDALSKSFFPDEQFRNCLLKHRPKLPKEIYSLDCSDLNIMNLKGIDRLTSLMSLDASKNQLRSLKIGAGLRLQSINLSNNLLSSLELHTDGLRSLNARHNKLKTLKFSELPILSDLKLDNNQLKTLSLDHKNLRTVSANKNQLVEVKLEHATGLVDLMLRNNKLSKINLRPLLKLESADLRDNLLTDIVPPGNGSAILLLAGHSMTPEAIENVARSNRKMKSIRASKATFPDPGFRNCVELNLDRAAKDIHKLTCDGSTVTQSELTKINDLSGLETLTSLEELTLNNYGISTINIIALSKLKKLNVNKNSLTYLDLSKNTDLKNVSAASNQIKSFKFGSDSPISILLLNTNRMTRLDLNDLPNLTSLRVSNNLLSNLDITPTPRLRYLELNNNKLTDLDLSPAPYLYTVSAKDNSLSKASAAKLAAFKPKKFTLDPQTFNDQAFHRCVERAVRSANLNSSADLRRLSCDSYSQIKNTVGIETLQSLESFDLSYSEVSEIDLSRNLELVELRIEGNDLTRLDLTKNQKLESISVRDATKLEEIKISSGDTLERISATRSKIKKIDIGVQTSLKSLILKNNKIASFQLANAIKLRHLNISNNQLKYIDLTSMSKLEYLDLSFNKIQKIDFPQTSQLETINIGSNKLVEIDLSNQKKIKELTIAINKIRKLDVSHLEQLKVVVLMYNPISNLKELSDLNLETLAVDVTQLEQLRSVSPDYINSNPIILWAGGFVIGKLGLWGM